MPITLRESLNQRLLNKDFTCEKELTLSLISGKWKVVLIWHLAHEGPLRFGQMMRLFENISQRILTKQLREMEQDGLILRKVYDETIPKVEYSLTELGMTLVPIVDAMWLWGQEHMSYYAEKVRVKETRQI